MAVEKTAGLTLGESRKLRRDPETVYVDTSGERELRVAVVRSGDYPHPATIIVRRFDYAGGQWRAGNQGGRFINNDGSRRSIAVMAIQGGYRRRRV